MVNKAFFYKQAPKGFPVAGQDVAIDTVSYDADVATPAGGVVVQTLYSSFDPYMRGRMRDASVKSYAAAWELNTVIPSNGIAKVLRSDSPLFQEGDLVIGFLPIQEYTAIEEPQLKLSRLRKLENPLGLEDIRVFLGPLGMPGLTAYSSLYKIGQPKAGETIFVSTAAGAVGQMVGQIAKHEGLKVIGSVGSQEKLDFITKELGFDGGFNYKEEKPADALARLAPEGVDIYYDNVGGEHLEAALEAMRDFGRIVVCGRISEYNTAPQATKGIGNVLSKRLLMQGFIVGDPGMGPAYTKEHQERVQAWIKDGSLKVLLDETDGIDNAPEGLVGIFHGKNMGKALLKFEAANKSTTKL